MKKSILPTTLLLISTTAIAQSIFIPSGTGGIGNNTTTLNVGIGTAIPSSTFHVKSLGGNTYMSIEKTSSAYEGGFQFRNNGHIDFFFYSDNATDALKLQAGSLIGEEDSAPRIEVPVNNKNLYFALSGGNVGIGTRLTSDYRLAVDGKIGAREVNVNTDAWSDYVFADDYKLPSLETIGRFIKQYRHLPDVPTAEEVKLNGIDLGATDALLLKKIEDLTLYMIEIKNENEALKEEMARLKAVVNSK